MYDVDLDLVLHFVPPMDDKGPGIRLNRIVHLPFLPSANVAIFSKTWEQIDGEPLGYNLKDITWDVDRGCFFAKTFLCHHGDPIAMIPHEVAQLVECGWRIGSYLDNYGEKDRRGRARSKLRLPRKVGRWDPDEVEAWETADCRSRPDEFLIIWHSVIATMATLDNHCAVAYAMLKNGYYSSVVRDGGGVKLLASETKFLASMNEFSSMPFEGQWKWRDRVKRKYPRLVDVVDAIR